MKKVRSLISLVLGFCFFASLLSCEDDEPAKFFTEGVFVVNEGNFNEGDGSVSHFMAPGEVSFNIFQQSNGDQPLGDIVQSMTLKENNGYIVVNNSNKVEVVNYETMQKITTIEDVLMPRYIAFSGDIAFISEWVSYSEPGRVAVVNISDHTINNRITTGYGADYLLIKGNVLYVSNHLENTISVIDIEDETVRETITVATGPGKMVEDENGDIWVICAGGYNDDYSPKNDGAIIRIDPSTNSVEETFELDANVNSSLAVSPSADILYYLKGNSVYQLPVSSTELSAEPLINSSDFIGLYGLGVDPGDGTLYIADNKGLQSNGEVYRYQADGSFIDQFNAGRGPNGFAFIP